MYQRFLFVSLLLFFSVGEGAIDSFVLEPSGGALSVSLGEEDTQTVNFDWADAIPVFETPAKINLNDGCQEITNVWDPIDYVYIEIDVSLPTDFSGNLEISIEPTGVPVALDSNQYYGMQIASLPPALPSDNCATEVGILCAYKTVQLRDRFTIMQTTYTLQVEADSANTIPVYLLRTQPVDAIAIATDKRDSVLPYTATFKTVPESCSTGKGDPIFFGLNGQRFTFNGHPGKVYNIYSDPFMSLNSLFSTAHVDVGTKNERGTVMEGHGLRMGTNSLSFEADSLLKNGSIIMNVNNLPTIFEDGYKGHIDSCIEIEYKSKQVFVASPTHGIAFSFKYDNDSHINQRHIDIKLRVPQENISELGGLLGQTVLRTAKLDLTESKYLDTDLLSTDAPTNVFQGKAQNCVKNINRRSASTELRALCSK